MKQYPYQGSQKDTENVIYAKFEEQADAFVCAMLRDYEPQHYERSKAVHDCVWGTVLFYPWELQIMDSPLLQRLRKINQLGLALYTYPSAHHSRFEHTLGVVAVAAKMIESISNGVWGDSDNSFKICQEHICMIRMAALLHDVGHCFFSHLSECIYSEMKEFRELKESFGIFRKAQAHEILGYVIVNTPSFRTFFNEKTDYPYKGRTRASSEQLLETIGRMIIGSYPSVFTDSENNRILPYYLTEMINGQFDADALDYLRRDSYATGLDLTYNLDRFLYKIRIVEREEESEGAPVFGQHLTIPASGISTIEEMMYNKQMLTRYIYQHQKVMAVDSLVTDIAHGMMRNGRLRHPCDFLYLTDDNIYMLQSHASCFEVPVSQLYIAPDSDKTLSSVAQKIAMRNLPKKALIINAKTIAKVNGKEPDGAQKLAEFVNGFKSFLRREIYEEAVRINNDLGGKFTFDTYDIHVAVPRYSLAKDYSTVYVIDNDNTFVPISDVVNLNSMSNTYADYSWNAYIFSSGDILPLISIAAKKVFEDHGAEFDKSVFSHLKHAKQIEELMK